MSTTTTTTEDTTAARNAIKSLDSAVRKFVALGRSNAQTAAKVQVIARAVEYGNSVNAIHAAIAEGMHAAGKFDAPSRATVGAYATTYREVNALSLDVFDESHTDLTARVFAAVSNVKGDIRKGVYAAAMALPEGERAAFILDAMPVRTPRDEVKTDAATAQPVEAVDATPEDVVSPAAQPSHPAAGALAQSLGLAAHHAADYSADELRAILSAVDKFAAAAAPLLMAESVSA